jgi:anthranilate phosphoribosyltransferase
MLKEALQKLIEKQDLTEAEMQTAISEIMSGEASPALIGGFLTALRLKGETVEEITGAAKAMREKAEPIPVKKGSIDTCGTGGDGSKTFNISTTVAFVLAGVGLPVAKHGNRAMSSKCGSADLLEALGVKIDLEPNRVAECIENAGIGFLFAPVFHKAMKHAVGPRKELGFRTIFNLLGPLTNPALADYQIVGVYAPELAEPLAAVLSRLGARRCMVVHGTGGLDELSLAGVNIATFYDGENIQRMDIDCENYGLARAGNETLIGGDAMQNAEITKAILSGEQGPRRDVVLLNAGTAIFVAGLAPDIQSGIEKAAESIDSGAALKRLELLQRMAV